MRLIKLLTGIFSAIFRRRIRTGGWVVINDDAGLALIAPDGSLIDIDIADAPSVASLFENGPPEERYFVAARSTRPSTGFYLRSHANGLVIGYRAANEFKEAAMSGTSARALALLLRQMIERNQRREYRGWTPTPRETVLLANRGYHAHLCKYGWLPPRSAQHSVKTF